MAEEEEEEQLWETVDPVEFAPKMKERTDAQALLVLARQGSGYEVAGGQLSHAIQSRATHVLMDFSAQGCALRYQVDGIWEQLPPLDRETADAMLYAIKQLCLMNPADRRSPQTGKLDLKLVKQKFELNVQSQGVPTGERVLCKFESESIPFEKLIDLGMRDKMYETFKEKIDSDGSVILITAPKGLGLTTTWTVAIGAADRFIRDFQSIEDEANPDAEIINVVQNFFGGDTGKTEAELVRSRLLKEPDSIVFPELPTPESMAACMEQVESADKQVICRMVANTPMEGLVQFIARYPDSAKSLSNKIAAVLGQRLVRRLCENCKSGFEPPPQLLQQLGIPQGRVAMLYQPFIPPPIEQQVDEDGNPAPITPCHVCNGRGFHGRIAIFELITPGEQLRTALQKTQDVAQLNAVAKADGHRGLQTEAVLTFARGLTSLDELKKMFAK